MPIIRFILNPEKKSYKKGKEIERKEGGRTDLSLENNIEEIEFIATRSGKFKFVFILVFKCKILVVTLETNPKLKRNVLKFGYGINYKYEGQFSSFY